MIVLSSESEYRGARCVVVMGMFDGVHLGHRALIGAAKRRASEMGAPLLVYTYANHPLTVLRPQAAPAPLMRAEERRCVFEALGADYAIERRFTRELAATDAAAFLKTIALALRPLVIAAGYNHTFGRDGAGDAALVVQMAAELDYEPLVEPPFLLDGQPVSSSRVRACLRAGDIAGAGRLLGRAVTGNGSAQA